MKKNIIIYFLLFLNLFTSLAATLNTNYNKTVFAPKKIVFNQKYYAFAQEKTLYCWNTTNSSKLNIQIPIDDEGEIEISSDNKLIVGNRDSFGFNYIDEYSLSMSNGLPYSATLTTNFVFSKYPEGRWVRSLKTESGSIINITYRHNTSWNNDLVIRNTNGNYKSYYFEYFPPDGIVPSTYLNIIQSKADKNIYIFSVRDSTAVITMAKFKENNGSLEFLSFNPRFIELRPHGNDFTDGLMCPDYEFPPLLVYQDDYKTNRFLLSYTGANGSIFGGWVRLAYPVVTYLDILPSKPNPCIIDYNFSAKLMNNLYLHIQSESNSVYQFTYSEDLVHWVGLRNNDDGKLSYTATSDNSSVLVYHESFPRPNTLLVKASYQNYNKQLLFQTSDYVERANCPTPVFSMNDGVYYFISPMNTNTLEFTNTFLKKFNYSSKTITNLSNTPIKYKLIGLGNGYAAISSNNILSTIKLVDLVK